MKKLPSTLAAIAAGAILLSGCSDGEEVAQAVASVSHCGAKEVAPGLLMRLSAYSAGNPSDDIWIVQLCHPERGCSAVASYQNGMAPLADYNDLGLKITVPMATELKVFRDEAWVQGQRVPLLVEARRVASAAEANEVRHLLGLPPGTTSHHSCRKDLEQRSFYR
ncbi:hypothetical protein [Brevundimonas guildfordensis]|uniref:Lipoprotein n=1 Tax=Brevundimonas guildfordensis TaxID=2762241 RepID=A0ABR8QZX8_9CAUL|nr:hypothetical protein [Brevundimonas guildfordensis]MBD7941087.1 hypothetical protein [Brevundimonas guildfordensis]